MNELGKDCLQSQPLVAGVWGKSGRSEDQAIRQREIERALQREHRVESLFQEGGEAGEWHDPMCASRIPPWLPVGRRG